MSSILKIHAPRDLVETNFWYDVAKNITIADISELLQHYPSETVKNEQFYTNFRCFISDYFQQYNSLASGLTGNEYEYCRLLCYWIGKHAMALQSKIEEISVPSPRQSVLLGTAKNRLRWMGKMSLLSISKLKEQKGKMENDNSLAEFAVIMNMLCAANKSKLPDEKIVASIIQKTTSHATKISQYQKNYTAKKTITAEAKKNVTNTELSSRSTHKIMPEFLKLSAISTIEFTRLENISKKTGSYTVFDNVMRLQTMRRDTFASETTSIPTTVIATSPPPITTVVPVAQKPAQPQPPAAHVPLPPQQRGAHVPHPQPPGENVPPPPQPPAAHVRPPPPLPQQGIPKPLVPAAPATNKTEIKKSLAQTGEPKKPTIFEICYSKYGTDSLDTYIWEGETKSCPTSTDSNMEMYARTRTWNVHKRKPMNLKKETSNAQGSKSEDSTAEPETAVPETAAVHGLTSESVLLAKLKQVRNAVKTDSPDAGGKTASDEWSPAHHTIATEAKPPDIGAAAVVVLTQKNEENNRIVNDLLKQDIGDIPVVEDHTTGPLLAAPGLLVATPTHAVVTLTHPISDTSSINSTNVGPAVVPLVSGDIVALTHEVAVPEPAAPAAAHLAALSLKVATPPVPALTHKLAVPEPAADAAAHLAALSLKVATPPVPALTHKLAVPEPTADAAAHLAALSLKVATPPVQALTPKSVVPEVAAHPAPLTHPNSDKSLIDSTDVGPAVAPVVIHEPNQDDLDRLMNELY